MTTRILPLPLLAALLAGLPAGPAGATSRVFVSATGSDSNPCSFAQPCRGFQKAHDTVAAGGEIDVLDPAGYGLLIISKAISIQGHGYAGIASDGSGNTITVNAGATDAVNLRGLLIDGVGHGFSGIRVNSVGALTVQDTLIRNFTGGDGINFVPTGTGTVRLYITDTRIFDTGNLASSAINITPSGSGQVALGVLNRVEVNNSGGAALGIRADGNTATVTVEIMQCVFAKSDFGVEIASAGPPVTVRMTRTTVANNRIGYDVFGPGATLTTYGDNNISDNSSSTGSLTPFAHQ